MLKVCYSILMLTEFLKAFLFLVACLEEHYDTHPGKMDFSHAA